MSIVVGCDLEEFKSCYKKLALDKEWQGTFGFTEELDTSWERVLVKNPSLLLVWRENNEIIGHAIWHETSTDEHREGDPRDEEDRTILRRLLRGRKDNIVELHEIWLRKKYRGKGFGKRFFEFFERFIRNGSYDSIVYYTDHPAAIAICRDRGYKEGFLEKENWHLFCLILG
ncbi:MAG: GNAT family N-acetyltransferase [Candidatus Bathyarchaeia archaeon]